MGHEYVGVVEEVGSEVSNVKPGQFVVGSFATSDNTCANCQKGWQSSCLNREFMGTCQAEYVRIPNAHGTLVATDTHPSDELVPGLLAVSDEGIACIKDLTNGIGADSVLECVGTAQSMSQALHSARPGGNVGFVGVSHEVAVDGQELFYSHVGLRGGPAPVRRYLPDLIDRVLSGHIAPGRVFDLTLPLERAAEGYKAMDERRAIKTSSTPRNSRWPPPAATERRARPPRRELRGSDGVLA